MRVPYEMDVELWELRGLGVLLGVMSDHRVSGSPSSLIPHGSVSIG